jgi:hypothetical protein
MKTSHGFGVTAPRRIRSGLRGGTWRFLRLSQGAATLIDTLEQLSTEQLDRIGVHFRYGAMTLELWVEARLITYT